MNNSKNDTWFNESILEDETYKKIFSDILNRILLLEYEEIIVFKNKLSKIVGNHENHYNIRFLANACIDIIYKIEDIRTINFQSKKILNEEWNNKYKKGE